MKTIEELNLISPIRSALADANYKTPTPIQARTIPKALVGKDILGCAQTGTGKTAAFALPILNRLGQRNRKPNSNHPLALILAPTRELAIQIGESFDTYGKHLNLRHALVYGGVGQANQVKSLNRGVHIVVATPGRLLDLMDQGHLELNKLEVFVLDEVDRMLDMGFLPDLKRIIARLPDRRQSLFFSATMPPKISKLAKSLLRNPHCVDVTPKSSSVERIDQRMMLVERGQKFSALQKVLQSKGVERALVFTRTKRQANTVVSRLSRSSIHAVAIHGNKSQNARQRALADFQNNKVRVLVATDVASRGIDIEGISHVINFELPDDPESYVHRIGRTGRAGGYGIAISFCSEGERENLRDIERFIGKKIAIHGDTPRGARSATGRPKRASEQPSNRFGRKSNTRGNSARKVRTKRQRSESRNSRKAVSSAT